MLGTCSSRPRMGATPFLRATGSSTTTLLPLGSYVAWSCRSLPTSLQARGGAAGLLSSHERAFGLFAQQIAVKGAAFPDSLIDCLTLLFLYLIVVAIEWVAVEGILEWC